MADLPFERTRRSIAAACAGLLLTPALTAADPAPATNAPAAEAAVLSPAAEAFRADLLTTAAEMPEADRTAVDRFYAARNYAPFWTEAEAGRLEILLQVLARSDAQGLPLSRYDAAALSEAAREAAAMALFLRYAGDLAAGIVVPSQIDSEITVTPERPAAAALLAGLEAAPLPEVLADLEPDRPEYRNLIAEKARLEGLLATDAWGAQVSAGPTLREGESNPRVAELRARLSRLGYAAPGPLDRTDFDADLARTLQRFQRDHGLLDDGMAGPRTLSAVNASVEDRMKQVLVNLERMRWLNGALEPRHLYVNIPDFSVTLYDDGEVVYRTKAIMGTGETQTPEFSDVMQYFVVNPSWYIPDSIAQRVYLPKLKQDPSVLAANDMVLMTRSGTVIDAGLVDFRQVDAGNFPFRMRQKPSPENALGRVKFMFPNQFAIYLHDTPARELFAKDARAFSNGCVRLEEPYELAEILLRGQEPDPAAAFDAWLAEETERTVNLDRPIPVHLVYRTVFTEADGAVRYRDDIYGRDAAVFQALEAAGVTLSAAQG